MSRVLIVDDEPAICFALGEALRDEGHTVDFAASAEEALQRTAQGALPHAILLDVRLPGMNGLAAMQELRNRIGTAPIIVMTAFGNLETAVRAMSQGAFDYLVKPFDLDQATAAVRGALAVEQPSVLATEPVIASRDRLIGTSHAMQQVFKQIALVAPSEVNVLITGESGTGKELVARAIHQYSGRQGGAFFPICIAALNSNVIESELFGHVKGAFTGAVEDRRGLLELANGGTILLDEIGDVPLGLQVKLLRALEQREVIPVGGTQSRALNPRVLSATNRPLAELIAAGDFREDLFYRLGGFHIHLPPLRERQADILPLAEYFLGNTTTTEGASGRLQFSGRARAELALRPWQGNVRELRNAVEHAALLARQGEIRPEHFPRPIETRKAADLPAQIQDRLSTWSAALTAEALSQTGRTDLYEEFLRLVEPPVLAAVLRQCQGNKASAANLLGLHRATLRQKLRRHGQG